MILKFSFEYISTSLILEKLLQKELKKNSLEGKFEKDEDIISLYVKGNESEIEKFANDLSCAIPVSLYLKDTKVEVVKTMPTINYELPSYPKRKTPPCPVCIKSALESYDPFTQCEACGYNIKKSRLIFKNFTKTVIDENEVIFQSLAKAIVNGAKAKIKTFSGYKSLSILNEKNYKDIKDGFDLLGVDIKSIDDIFSLSKGEILALGSFEKPVLNLPINLEFLKIFPFFDKNNRIRVRLSDDLILELIANEVKKTGGKYLILRDIDIGEKYHIELDFDEEIKSCSPLEVVVLSDGNTVITKGDRGLIPKANPGFQNISIKALSNNFVTVNQDNKIVVYKKEDDNFEIENCFTIEKEGKLYYEAAHGAFYSIITENKLFDKVIAGVYFSKANSDRVMINSPKFGLVDYIKFDYDFPSTVSELFDKMALENKTSAKLISNFTTKFPDYYKGELKFDKIGDIYKLWGVIAIVLGMQKDGNVQKATKKLIDYSLSFKGKKGPRIDYKLKRYEKKPTLDTLKTIKTSMSFALAGIDSPTLSFGIMESFAEFVSNMIDDITKDYDINGVALNGSLFEAPNLINKFYTITKKNYEIYLNKEFTLDDMNLGYGIINAACTK